MESNHAVINHNRVLFQQYYFGDANLVRDKFLKEEIKKDEGWVPLSVLLTFNRLKAMSEDSSVILKALSKSPNDLLEVGLTLLSMELLVSTIL